MKSLILVSLLFALGGVPAFADTATFKTGVGKIFTSDEVILEHAEMRR